MLTAAELEAIVERACTAAVERAFQRQAGDGARRMYSGGVMNAQFRPMFEGRRNWS